MTIVCTRSRISAFTITCAIFYCVNKYNFTKFIFYYHIIFHRLYPIGPSVLLNNKVKNWL